MLAISADRWSLFDCLQVTKEEEGERVEEVSTAGLLTTHLGFLLTLLVFLVNMLVFVGIMLVFPEIMLVFLEVVMVDKSNAFEYLWQIGRAHEWH